LTFVGDNGRFFSAPSAFLARLQSDALTPVDAQFLALEGHATSSQGDLGWMTHAYGVAQRLAKIGPLDYLILVPTLRCNLDCSYCQVSRAPEAAPGFDWSQETLAAVLAMIDGLETDSIKIEFQGGEPLLRPDLISAVMERCGRFTQASFVICTNLMTLDAPALALLDRADVQISTSLDGPPDLHRKNRTKSAEATNRFHGNLKDMTERYGLGKVSALPTLDPGDLPDPAALIEAYAAYGLTSIFLRPVNFQGFARKRHPNSRAFEMQWRSFYDAFVSELIRRNWADQSQVVEESYLSLCLRRIFRPGLDRHVDLRNPNPAGHDYIVVDYDGRLYPTDEARMLTRSRVIDLGMGHVSTGIDFAVRDALNVHATNSFDPDCQRCAYQPFCGRDLIDDLSRYGRVDLPRHDTAFCQRHLHIFDLAFDLIFSEDEATLYSVRRWLDLPGSSGPIGSHLQ
jgi:His-Xaa-Ser system radical SAM maturase HxsB